jgi:hypothetical protein
VQHLHKIKPNQFLEITEDGKVTPLNLKVLKFNATAEPGMPMQMADM